MMRKPGEETSVAAIQTVFTTGHKTAQPTYQASKFPGSLPQGF
jgi:hypothetical protein